MKFKEELVNRANVGDLVYGDNELDKLRDEIEGNDEEYLYKCIEYLGESAPELHVIYDSKTESIHTVKYVYPISDAVEESNLDKFMRILKHTNEMLNSYYRPVILDQFFKFKKRGLLSADTEAEEIALDYSYYLEDESESERILKEFDDLYVTKSIINLAYFLSEINADSRYVYHDADMLLRDIDSNSEVYNACRSMMIRFFDKLIG